MQTGRPSFIENFEWRKGSTPLSAIPTVATLCISYPCIIYFMQHQFAKRQIKPVQLGLIPACHNLILCVGSLIMFVGAFYHSVVESNANRWMWGSQGKYSWMFCFPPQTKSRGAIFFWSYIYYLSKYYELLDTFILVFKRKQIIFLHIYHHTFVIVMCYLWLEYAQSLQTIALMTNTGIHVIMYFYYFMHSIGIPPPWKKFVTNCQIIQFVFSFVASVPFLVHYFQGKKCAGFFAFLFNAFFNLSLLMLFANFHRSQYGKNTKKLNQNSKKD